MGTKTRTLTLAISGEDRGVSKPFDKAAKEGDKLADQLKKSGDKAGKGISDGVEDGVDKLGSKLKAGGKKAGEALGAGVKAGTDKIGGTLESAGSTGADLFSGGFDVGAIADALSGKLSDLGGKGGKLMAGVAAVGVAAGAAFVVGLMQGMENEVATDKLAAQLGGSEWAESQGKVAGDLYLAGWGESIAETGEAVKLIHQNGLLPEDATNKQIEGLGGLLLTFTDVLVQDMDMTTQAVSNMIRTGIADSSEEALDVMTRGIQQGADRAGDLAETFQEYATVFRDAGISAADATGLMVQGLQAGARDADTVADALKEFAIRGQDATESSAAGFKTIGLNAKEMTAMVAEGGPAARDALDQVLDGLRGVEDPVARNAAAVALFGTKAEDLGDALFSLDLDTAAAGLGNVAGATDGLNSAYDNASSKIETFKRGALNELTLFVGNEVIPAAQDLAETYGDDLGRGFETASGPVKDAVGYLKDNEGALKALKVAAVVALGAVALHYTIVGTQAAWAATKAVASSVAMVAGWVRTGVVAAGSAALIVAGWVATGASAVASAALQVASWAVSLAGAVATGIGYAVTFALMVAGWVATGVAAMAGALVVAAAWLISIWPIALVIAGIALVAAMVVIHFDTIKRWISNVFNWVKDNWPLLLAILTGPFGLAVLAIVRNWQTIKNAATGAKDWVVARFNDLVGFVTGMPGRIASAASGMWDGIKDTFRAALNAIIGWWNRISFTLPTIHIPGFDPPGPGPSFSGFDIGGQTFSTPNIPTLAEGGIVRARPGGTLVRMAEAGHDEAAIPLDGRHGLGGDTYNVFNIDRPIVANSAEFKQMVKDALNELLGVDPRAVTIRGAPLATA